MVAGQFYIAADPELRHMRKTARQQMQVFNNELDGAKRSEILKTLFGKTGNRIYMNLISIVITEATFMSERISMLISTVLCLMSVRYELGKMLCSVPMCNC